VATSSFSKYDDLFVGRADSLGGAGGLNRFDRSESAVLLIISNWIDVECLGLGVGFSFFVGEGLSSCFFEAGGASDTAGVVLGGGSFPFVADDISI